MPTISYELRTQLFTTAQKLGFREDRQIEMVGRSASEMVLQLLGGSTRLNPTNGHQLPTVVVLCGPHTQGAQGVNCARQLANHNVKVQVFIPSYVKLPPQMEEELQLFRYCEGSVTSSLQGMCVLYLWIEVHFLYWLGNKWHGFTYKFLRSSLCFTKFTREPVSLYFPINTKKAYLYPYIYAKMTNNP